MWTLTSSPPQHHLFISSLLSTGSSHSCKGERSLLRGCRRMWWCKHCLPVGILFSLSHWEMRFSSPLGFHMHTATHTYTVRTHTHAHFRAIISPRLRQPSNFQVNKCFSQHQQQQSAWSSWCRQEGLTHNGTRSPKWPQTSFPIYLCWRLPMQIVFTRCQTVFKAFRSSQRIHKPFVLFHVHVDLCFLLFLCWLPW